MKKAVFLDRDGTVNKIVSFPELGLLDSPLNPRQFCLLPDVAEAIRIFNGLGLKVIIASNQPGIAKKKMSHEIFEKIRLKMRKELEKKKAHIDAEYYCFHHPSALDPEYKLDCRCRKPEPGLLLKAAVDLGLDLSECYIIGDSLIDIKAGRAAGCRTCLIGIPKCDLCKFMDEEKVKPDIIVANLLQASKLIEKEIREQGSQNRLASITSIGLPRCRGCPAW